MQVWNNLHLYIKESSLLYVLKEKYEEKKTQHVLDMQFESSDGCMRLSIKCLLLYIFLNYITNYLNGE